jgi:hypothetical protein
LVKAKVADLFRNGALDEDNMRALRYELVSWRETWTDAARQQAESRRKVSATLLAQLSQTLEVANFTLEQTRRHRDEVHGLRKQLHHKLGITTERRDDTESLEHLLNPRTSRVSRHLNISKPASYDITKDLEQ